MTTLAYIFLGWVTVVGYLLALMHVGKRADQPMRDEDDGEGGEPEYPRGKGVVSVVDYKAGRVDASGAVVYAGENDVRVLH